MITYERREYWEAGYQDSSIKSERRWAVCACGWETMEHKTYGSGDNDFRVRVLEHQVGHLVELVSADPSVNLPDQTRTASGSRPAAPSPATASST